MAEVYSGLITIIISLIMEILNFGSPTLINEQNLSNSRFKRSTIDSYSSSCPSNYYCIPRSHCTQSGHFNPVERSIISLASCQSADYSSSDYVCCPSKPETKASSSALKVAKLMGDKMIRIMLDKQSANQQSKTSSQSSSDILDDTWMDEVMSSLENIKN